MSAYQYTELQISGGKKATRIVRLKPGLWNEPLSCDLEHVYLEDGPCYQALSYFWGDPKLAKFLSCDGHRLSIPENIYYALLWLRSETEERTLWIDAICIHQSDIDERNYQVSMMRSIYQAAASVVVWLGWSPQDPSTMGLQLIPELIKASEWVRNMGMAPQFEEPTVLRYKSNLKLVGLPPAFDPAYKDLRRLMEKEWFERIWVLQEVAVGHNVQLQYKDQIVSWEDWVQALQFSMNTPIAMFELTFSASLQALKTVHMRGAFRKNQEFKLLDLLYRFQDWKASDGRDMVYALLGLASDAEQLKITPDYRLTPKEVYRRTVVANIQQHSNLDALALCYIRTTPDEDARPSWIPDWGRSAQIQHDRTFFIPFAMLESVAGRKTNFRTSLDNKCLPLYEEDGFVLIVQGCFFDTIIEASPDTVSFSSLLGRVESESFRSGDMKLEDITSDTTLTVWRMWEKFVGIKSRAPYVTGESILDAYLQMISCNTLISNNREDVRKQYFRWRRPRRQLYLATKLRLGDFKGFMHLALFLVLVANHLLGKGVTDRSFPQLSFANLRVARTSKGYLCMIPQNAKPGDQIHLVKGSRTPLIFRPVDGDDASFRVVSDCYVQGIMLGEAFSEDKCKRMRLI